MALNPSTVAGHLIKFHTPAVEPNALLVLSAVGRDAISQPYSFELELASTKKHVDCAAVMRHPAVLAIKQGIKTRDNRPGVQTRRFNGVLAWFEQGDRGGHWTIFHALLVPRIWLLSLNVRSRVYQKSTVPKIVECILKEHGFGPGDFEWRLSREYAEREYVVQYQESDLDFVSRLLEKEGVFYFFCEGDDRERVVFGDSPAAHVPILGCATVRYDPVVSKGTALAGPEAWFKDEVVRSIALRRRRTHENVLLQDHNYRTPRVDLTVRSNACDGGYGTLGLYGEHYKTPEEGALVARLRAEEVRCGEQVYRGVSDVRSLRAGATFALCDHYTNHADFDRDYLVTEVRHKGEQMIPLGGVGKFAATYHNDFVAIPAETPYRPPRRTPVPKAGGVLNAIIDAAGDAQYAKPDDEGRYTVRLPFDPGEGEGRSSRAIRMMQPYIGDGMGMAFPLHKGTEVLVVHTNADWDRPIIAGAVPDGERKSVVGSGNASQCVIASGGGNRVEMEDIGGGERVTVYSPVGNTIIGCGAPPEGFA